MAKKLSPMEQRSSSKVLDELRKHTQGMMKGKMDGLKKVTVASDSPEGLKKGLDLAKKIAGTSDSSFDEKEPEDSSLLDDESTEEASESPEEESLESPEEEASEQSDGSEILPEEEAMDAQQLENHIKALQALRFKKK